MKRDIAGIAGTAKKVNEQGTLVPEKLTEPSLWTCSASSYCKGTACLVAWHCSGYRWFQLTLLVSHCHNPGRLKNSLSWEWHTFGIKCSNSFCQSMSRTQGHIIISFDRLNSHSANSLMRLFSWNIMAGPCVQPSQSFLFFCLCFQQTLHLESYQDATSTSTFIKGPSSHRHPQIIFTHVGSYIYDFNPRRPSF